MPGNNGQGDDIVDQSLVTGDDDDGLDGVHDDDSGGEDLTVDTTGKGKTDGDDGARAAADAGGDDVGFELEIEKAAEAGAETGGLTTDDEDDDPKKWSEKMRKRVERERAIARRANARAEAERALRVQAETRAVKVQKSALEITEEAVDAQIVSTTEALKAAKEAGKTEDEITHQTMLSRLHARKEGLQSAKAQVAEEEGRVKAASAAPAPNELAAEWKRRNTWFGHDRYPEQTQLTRALDVQIRREGYDPNDPGYYAELDRRVRRRMPEMARMLGGQQQRRQETVRREPTGGVVRRPAAAPANGTRGRVLLTLDDQVNMRNFGLDPKNPAHQKEYATQKMGGANG